VSPPVTIRQQLVDKLIARLARIQIVNSFATDIGLQPAEDWPTRYTDFELRTATHLGIFDLEDESTQTYPGELKIINELSLQVRIFHARETTPAQLRVMMGDVMQAIISDETTGAREPTFGGVAIDTKQGRSGFIIPKETFAIDGAAVSFTVEFLAQPFNAYE
jgi:hypothetical protein